MQREPRIPEARNAGDAEFQSARDLFFAYEGSRFYMSRDGAEELYETYGVPSSIEQQWLAELTALKLDSLEKPGNWWTINFLIQHDDPRHLEKIVATPPLGKLWERTAFLEWLLRYVDVCEARGVPHSSIQTAVDVVYNRARELIHRSRSERSRTRLAQLIDLAEVRRKC